MLVLEHSPQRSDGSLAGDLIYLNARAERLLASHMART